MMDCKAMTTPMASNLKILSNASSESVDAIMYRQMIGSMMYLMNMRPDIFFVLNTLRHVHLMVAKHAVRYLQGIVECRIKYDTNQKTNLHGYVDFGSVIEKKTTLGCFFSLRSSMGYGFGRMDSCMALRTDKEKYVATFSVICERGSVKLRYMIQIEISRKRE